MQNVEMQDVLGALRKADKAGNVEDAKKLATIADKLSKTQQIAKSEAGSRMAKGFSRALGAPADVMSSAFGWKPQIGGSKSIEKGFEAIGIGIPEGEAQTTGEYAREGVGEMISMFIPSIGVTKALTLGKGTGTASTIAKQMINTMKKHPFSTAATEISGGAGMGAGRKIGEEHPALKPYAELAGGVLGSMGPQAATYFPSKAALTVGRKVAKKVSLPFSEAGAKYRAGVFMKAQVADPEAAAVLARTESVGGLPPAVMTGEERLMSLYNRVKALDPVQDKEAIKQLSNAAFKLEQEMMALGQGSPEVLQGILEKRIGAIELGMDSRITKSMSSAQDKLDKLPVARRQSAESVIVRDELTKVMSQEKKLVDAAWGSVPKKAVVGVENTKSAFAKILEDIPTAQRGDIPAILRNHLAVDEKTVSTTINEMQGLRAKLLETARQSRSVGKWNKARISNDMAGAILEDMTVSSKGVVTEGGSQLKVAIAATNKFKSRFEQGTVGKILGFDKTSAPSIAPELTLDIATRGKGVVDINKVVVTPEATAATEKYLARSFTDYSLDNTGVINPQKAEKWIQNNEEILDSFPNLRDGLSDVSTSQKIANQTKVTMDARKARLRNPKISEAARFLNADIGNEIKTILKSPNPSLATQKLVTMARKDTTGAAMEGLRGGFVEYMFERASVGGYNALGEKTLSGNAILGFINDNRGVMRRVFSQEQIHRASRIGRELSKLEMLEKSKRIPIEVEDTVSNLLKFGSKFGGAAVGRNWARAVGAGGTVQIPGYFAAQWHKVASYLTKNRFERLVNDAIMSPDRNLLEALLMPIDKPTAGPASKEVSKRLNAWLLASGSNVLQDIKEDD